MTDLQIGDKAPEFTLPTNNNGEFTLSSLKGQYAVLYFYPKDNTPGCTTESCAFRDAFPNFEKLNTAIIGISKCSVKKHDNFVKKYDLNFPLASDENNDVCKRYGTWKEKSMYGKNFLGIERATFIIDPEGNIAAIWRKVKVKGHVDEVQETLNNLIKD
ncbi:MAG: thioredoxin-dependent thiol peroxidase [Alphaproteobacteria bacterium]